MGRDGQVSIDDMRKVKCDHATAASDNINDDADDQ